MRYLTIIITFLLIAGTSSAVLPSPPVIKDIPTSQYLWELYNIHNSFTVITSSPNGTREAKSSGEVVIVNTNNVFKFWINQGGTTWVQI